MVHSLRQTDSHTPILEMLSHLKTEIGGVKRQENDHVPDVSSAFYDVKTAKYEEVKEKTSTAPTSTTTTTQKIPIPVFEENLNEDEFASVLNTIFKSANRKE